jgi:MoaA/NifB/PqqE/SkfB family radical SAM enzyme
VRVRSALDRERRHPVHVVWELTLACNLRCAHCGSRAGRPRSDELTLDEIRAVVAELAELGTREISLIGGEAYLRRDWLDIVRAVGRFRHQMRASDRRPRLDPRQDRGRGRGRPRFGRRLGRRQ